jgi:hypothetical protein
MMNKFQLRLICRIIVVCVASSSSFMSVYAQTESTPSSSLLDDLIIPQNEQGDQDGRNDGSNGNRSLTEELSSISVQMESAAAVLSSSKEVDSSSLAKALQLQQNAINALNRLLQKKGSKSSSQSSSEEDSAQQQTEAQKSDQPQESPADNQQEGDDSSSPSPMEQPAEQSEKQPSQPNPSSDSTSQQDGQTPSDQTAGQETSGMPTKQTVVDLLNSIETSGRSNWGKLPQRLRDQMQNSGSLEFTPGYERQTRDYFRNLNEAILKMNKPPSK